MSNRQPCKDFLKGICTKLPCDNWHPPESQNRVVHSAISARFRTGRLRNNQIKSRKRVVTKCSGHIDRCATVALCISRHRAAGIFIGFTEGPKNLGTNSTSTIRSIDYIGGLNLNFRGNDDLASLRTWISETFEEFREMQIVRHAEYVGTMIGPHGHLHRWTAARKIHSTRDEHQFFYPKSG